MNNKWKLFILCQHLNRMIMAKLNRDYGKGIEFLFWTIMFVAALVALMVWIYHINFNLTF